MGSKKIAGERCTETPTEETSFASPSHGRERRYEAVVLYLWRDLNPHPLGPDPKSGVSADSTTQASLRLYSFDVFVVFLEQFI
jgi:hypothetical protein